MLELKVVIFFFRARETDAFAVIYRLHIDKSSLIYVDLLF